MRRVVLIAASGLSGLILVGSLAAWCVGEVRRSGPLGEGRVVVIPRGAGLGQIAEQLGAAGVIRWPALLQITADLAKLGGTWDSRAGDSRAGDLRAGEYAFTPGESLAAVLDQLHHGRTVVHRITVPEGLSSAQVLALVQGDPVLSGDLHDLPKEGSLLPDTYHFSLADSRAGLILRMKSAMSATLRDLWPTRAANLPLQTPEQAVVLASIIERETALPVERARIAGVFYNRLAAGMRLQSDPTVIYALTGGKGPLGRPLVQADWHLESPFNTYLVEGLPPGPIGNPGRASLVAALNPEHHDFLYFVADGTGGHVFAKTLADHNHNVAQWRRLERQGSERCGGAGAAGVKTPGASVVGALPGTSAPAGAAAESPTRELPRETLPATSPGANATGIDFH